MPRYDNLRVVFCELVLTSFDSAPILAKRNEGVTSLVKDDGYPLDGGADQPKNAETSILNSEPVMRHCSE